MRAPGVFRGYATASGALARAPVHVCSVPRVWCARFANSRSACARRITLVCVRRYVIAGRLWWINPVTSARASVHVKIRTAQNCFITSSRQNLCRRYAVTSVHVERQGREQVVHKALPSTTSSLSHHQRAAVCCHAKIEISARVRPRNMLSLSCFILSHLAVSLSRLHLSSSEEVFNVRLGVHSHESASPSLQNFARDPPEARLHLPVKRLSCANAV
jgi:hypothetical protein